VQTVDCNHWSESVALQEIRGIAWVKTPVLLSRFICFVSVFWISDTPPNVATARRRTMEQGLPRHFIKTRERYPAVITALKELGEATRTAGPIDPRTAHLIQLSAAAAQWSEGGVHSHVRRALEAGSSPEEIRHALILLIPTIGYPNVAAALSWADDVLESSPSA
jgi:4-carboxymuconolactone decarboxylase